MIWEKSFLIFTSFLSVNLCRSATILQESVMGFVGAENYTYYELKQPGTVYIFLQSLQGDADLYISQTSGKPTYDITNHDLQSTTCGLDYLQVPYTFGRPLTIAVYGHPSHELSVFEMKILVDDSVELEPVYSYDSSISESMDDGNTVTPPVSEKKGESESVLFTILLGMLQVLFDILVD